jgi:hypothetical protein
MEVNDDSLFKKAREKPREKPREQAPTLGLFAPNFCTKRRGRDSFGTVFDGLGLPAIPDASFMPINDL